MATEGVNLLGANQWQALQFQEAAKNQAVIPHTQETNAAFQPPQTLPLTPTQTGQAVHLEAMPDRLDLSTGDSLQSNGGHGDAHGQGSLEEETPDEEGSPKQRWEPATLEEARNLIDHLAPAELLKLSIGFAPTTGERQQLAALMPTTVGPFSAYAHQANLTAGPVQLLVRCLHVCAHQSTDNSERVLKLLTILKATTTHHPELGGLFSLLLKQCQAQDMTLPAFLENLVLRLEASIPG